MADEKLTKVFHAARQDLEIIWNLAKLIPAPLFDTQVAAMVCGFGDQVSYGDLVQTVAKVTLDKSSRFTDWSRRPLLPSPDRLRHRRRHLSARHLPSPSARLEKTGRLAWLADEMALLSSPATYEQHPDNAWERFRNRVRKPRDLAVLMDVAGWREAEAQARNVPRSRVLKDDVLIELALAAPRTRRGARQSARLSARHGALARRGRYSGGDRARPRARSQNLAETRARAARRQWRRDRRTSESAAASGRARAMASPAK